MKMNTPKLPSQLAGLPQMNFTRGPAPSAAAEKRPDLAYNIGSAEALAREFDRREARIVKR